MTTFTASLLLDRAAIGLSTLCVLHCLALPLLLVLAPSLAVLPIADEQFHLLLVYLVLPTSILALFLGCRRHHRWSVLMWGMSGVGVLVFTALLGHDLMGELGEKVLTVMGALLVVVGHGLNFRLCRSRACTHR
jgi:FtsH-binding integral membrane protein